MKYVLAISLFLTLAGCSGEAVFQGRATSSWVNQFKDKDPAIRQEAIRALGQIGPDAVLPLCKALEDPNSNVRMSAADALGRIGEDAKGAVAALNEALKDPDRNVRRHAAFALGIIDPADKSVVPALIESLKDRDLEVRRLAAVALGRFGREAMSAVPALNEAIKFETDDWCRRILRDALEKINEEVTPN
jgi:HEAT repeat protein